MDQWIDCSWDFTPWEYFLWKSIIQPRDKHLENNIRWIIREIQADNWKYKNVISICGTCTESQETSCQKPCPNIKLHSVIFKVGNRGLPWFMFLLFLVKKTSGILFFGPSFRKPARKASSGEIYLKKQGFICFRPVNMIQQN